ncbi:hypothetical protein TWF696_009501 [Orbilia brochopaga]|uniref:Uncharacterized protein n=1 Tax=Orbilia brochopaga TaxID=3140254 RepID=A0AAV9UD09_9PEZI
MLDYNHNTSVIDVSGSNIAGELNAESDQDVPPISGSSSHEGRTNDTTIPDEDAYSVASSRTLCPSSPRSFSSTISTVVDWEGNEPEHLCHDDRDSDSSEARTCPHCLIASLEDRVSDFKTEVINLRLAFTALSTSKDDAASPETPTEAASEIAPCTAEAKSDSEITPVGTTTRIAGLHLRSVPLSRAKTTTAPENDTSDMRSFLLVSKAPLEPSCTNCNIRRTSPNTDVPVKNSPRRGISTGTSGFFSELLATLSLFVAIMFVWSLAAALILRSTIEDMLEDADFQADADAVAWYMLDG